MQNELEGLYNMLVSQTDIMKNVDELVEKQIEHELMQFKELEHGAIMNVSVINIWQLLKLRKKKASWQDLTMQ